MNLGYWARRAYLNLKGFAAATLAMFLPSAAPIFRKMIAGYLGKAAALLNLWLGLEADWNPVIVVLTSAAIGFLEQLALWRLPNEKPTADDKANPVVKTAVDVPPT